MTWQTTSSKLDGQLYTYSLDICTFYCRVGVDYYTLLYTTVDKQVWATVILVSLDWYICYAVVVLFQMSAEIQDYLANRITKGHVPSYQLYLHLNDVLKLAVNIPPKYACLYVHVCMTMCVYLLCAKNQCHACMPHTYTHAHTRTHTHTHIHTHTHTNTLTVYDISM